MKNKKLVIATDLDRTFLEGSPTEKEQFYQFFASEKEKMDNVYLSQFPGISGIIDGVNYFQA